MAFTKLALIRDSSVPIGQPAPMHLECKCNNRIEVNGDRNSCLCGAIYDAQGYVVVASIDSKTEVYSRYD